MEAIKVNSLRLITFFPRSFGWITANSDGLTTQNPAANSESQSYLNIQTTGNKAGSISMSCKSIHFKFMNWMYLRCKWLHRTIWFNSLISIVTQISSEYIKFCLWYIQIGMWKSRTLKCSVWTFSHSLHLGLGEIDGSNLIPYNQLRNKMLVLFSLHLHWSLPHLKRFSSVQMKIVWSFLILYLIVAHFYIVFCHAAICKRLILMWKCNFQKSDSILFE